MRLSNHHKAYVGVLGVALAALAVDTFVLRDDSVGPAQAQAAAPAAPSAAPTPAPTAPAPAGPAAAAPALAAKPSAPAAPAKPRLATRLQALKDAGPAEEITQLFADGPQWLNPPPPEPEPAAVVGGTDPTGAPVKAPSHELTSVLVAGDRSCVILDGHTLRIGDRLGELKLVSVELGAATFEMPDGQIVRMVAVK